MRKRRAGVASPIGHGLAAIAAGALVARPAVSNRAATIQAGIFAAVGLLPDVDLLIGRHSAETHSIGAAVVIASLLAMARVPVASHRRRIWLAILLAWMTHPLLDAFTADSSVPIGIMVWWPFSSAYYHSGIALFDAIHRRWWLPGFWEHNVIATARELLIVAPLAATIWWTRRKGPQGSTRRTL